MQCDKTTLKLTIMKTFIIVEAISQRYHIYNADGDCVAILSSRKEVCSYIHDALFASSFTSYTFKYTAAPGTFIVTMK